MSLAATIILAIFITFSPVNNAHAENPRTVDNRVAKGSSIMEEVFRRFHINYEMSRTHKIGYYQEAMQDTAGVHYLAESIVDVYVPHNLSQKEHASVKPIRSRKLVFEEVDDESLLFGNAGDMARCSIWRPNSFLGEKNRDNYTYQYKDDSLFHRLKVFVIEFSPTNSKGNVSGKMLIDQVSYAILHIDYTPDAAASKLWSKVTWIEEFYFVQGKYELSKVKFEGLCSKNTYEYSATLIMQHVKVLSQIPESDHFIDQNASIFEHANEDYGENFWTGFHDLKNDVDAEEIVQLVSNRS